MAKFKHTEHKFIVVLLLASFLIAGCGAGYLAMQVKPFTLDLATWPTRYQQNFDKLETFTGEARLTVESVDFSGHVTVKTYWKQPDNLYIQAEGPFGLDIGKVFVGSSRFIVYNQYDNHFLSGSVEDPYLNRFPQTNFTFKQLKNAILGYAFQTDEPITLSDELHGIFTTQSDGIEYRYIVNPESGLLETCQLSRNDNVFLRQEFKKYRLVDGIYMPGIITLTMPEQKERISVLYKNMQANVTVDFQKYLIEVGTKTRQLNLN